MAKTTLFGVDISIKVPKGWTFAFGAPWGDRVSMSLIFRAPKDVPTVMYRVRAVEQGLMVSNMTAGAFVCGAGGQIPDRTEIPVAQSLILVETKNSVELYADTPLLVET